MSNTTRAQKIAVNMLINNPRINVTANPRIWSVPMAYRTIAVIRVVKLESTMVTVARAKPLRMAMRTVEPFAISSRMRS